MDIFTKLAKLYLKLKHLPPEGVFKVPVKDTDNKKIKNVLMPANAISRSASNLIISMSQKIMFLYPHI